MQKFTKKHITHLESYLKVKKNPGIHEKNLWKKVKKYQKYLEKIPGIQCICICNSLAMNACHKDSDIDLFIITKNDRLWTARIFLTLFFTILGKRKTSRKHAGQFCLSFFISEEQLSLEKIALKNDTYLYYWLKTLTPIINKNSTFERFISKNKKWCDFENDEIITKHRKNSEQGLGITYKLLTSCGDYCEKLLKAIFLPHTKKSFQKLGKPFGVVISDTILKFHDQDRRKDIKNNLSS